MPFPVRGLIVAVVALLAAQCMAGVNDTCELSRSKLNKLVALPFEKFDQPHNGWRSFYEARCFEEAASLLVAYIERHPDVVRERSILPFRAGQMFALQGRYETAVRYMRQSYATPTAETLAWDLFVDANVALLLRDYSALTESRRHIAELSASMRRPDVPDLAVGEEASVSVDFVDGLIACFNEPYEVAYGEPCRQRFSVKGLEGASR